MRNVRLASLLGLLLGVGAVPRAAAQDPAPGAEAPTTTPATQAAPPETQPQPTPPGTLEGTVGEITAAEVQARLQQVESATDLSETLRAQLVELYRQMLDQLAAAATWSEKAAEFRRGVEQAPAALAEAREALNRATTRPTVPAVPEVPADTSLDALTQRLADAEAELRLRQDDVRTLDAEAANRSQRANDIPQALVDANTRLARVTTDLAAAPPAGTPARVADAQRQLRQLRQRAIEAEIRALQREQDFYGARSEVLATRRDAARLALNEARARADAWRELVNRRRQAEAERQRRAAEAELDSAPASVRALAEKNKELAEELGTLQARTAEVSTRRAEVADRVEALQMEMKALRDRVGQEVLGEYMALEMRRARRSLIQLQTRERELRQDQREAQRVALNKDEYDQQRTTLTAARELRIEEELGAARKANPDADVERLRPLIEKQLERRRELLLSLDNVINTYLYELRDLVVLEGRLLEQVETYGDFIAQHVLWIRSAAPLHAVRPPQAAELVGVGLRVLGRVWAHDVLAHPVVYSSGLLLLAMALALQRRARRRMREIRERVSKVYSDRFSLTLSAIGHTLVLALPWALALWLLALRLARVMRVSDAIEYELAGSLVGALMASARLLLILAFLRQCCRPGGLFESHFRWNVGGVARVRHQLIWLTPLLVVGAISIAATELYPSDEWRSTLGRIVFIGVMVALALFALRVLHPARGIFAARLERHSDSWAFRLRYVWYALVVAIPLALAVAAWVGYYYTSIQLAKQVVRTVWVLLGLLFLHALLVRWLFVAQRRLAIEQARRKRAALLEARAAQAKAAGEGGELDEPPPPLDEDAFDIVSIGAQTRDLLRTLLIFGLILGVLVTWSDLLPALSFMDRVRLWSYTVEAVTSGAGDGLAAGVAIEYVTLKHVTLAILVSIVTYVLARNIPGLLEIVILQRLPIDTGGRFAVTAIARYVIVAIGVTVAFGAIGVGWSKVQWLIAAISVGLGFGLQEIFANFVSGLMLLFERPIRIGDTVTVGDVSGTVTRIRIRATTITDWDRKELIIPNREFITGQVINWTLSDPLLRIVVPVGIAYGSDTDRAEALLLEIAREEPNVLAEPEPRALFLGFGDSALQYELRVFVPSVEYLLQTKHRLHKAIDREFRRAGIEIAFPQQDVHIRSIDAALPLVDRETGRAARPASPGEGGGIG